ncbi:CRISPR-associated endonuclease Cas3'' [Candidatus Magnetaquicoccus inordinatus]|uniref:CRISPR-associated endonuclease Cas3'' n=1 Tax=Candidatus Magnetaquicoccus inordinatus TaxID=2496818 RepID=UPI00102ABCFF|nr:CRISPR-associated endonuclease Cas3'' [Candidatus Magnetaquicoccus inordinatus]
MSVILHAHFDPLNNRAEPLFDGTSSHALQVAHLAARFAESMIPAQHSSLQLVAREAARMLGLWHDLGKASAHFQHYLHAVGDPHNLEKQGRIDHSSAGAQHSASTIPFFGTLLAFAIAGHHTGLPDWHGDSEGTLKKRLHKKTTPWQANTPAELLVGDRLQQVTRQMTLPPDPFAIAFLLRMLFSCLTDADLLATEAFLDPQRTSQRHPPLPSMAQLVGHLERYLAERFAQSEGEVNRQRQNIASFCRQAADLPPGFFSLTVPTGGGKTLSVLRFALHHAQIHGMQRVISAIPFTSIIEQNAQIYRTLFNPLGEGILLEQHAHLDPDDPETMRNRLAAENWQAPLIVTTNLQFFESFFAARPGRCRKLHHIARSVIVLDEAHALPIALLQPALALLKELVSRYGCTVVLCTATQAALQHSQEFSIGLKEVREIIPDPVALHQALQRVQVRQCGTLSLLETAQRMAALSQVLAIVNSRHHARELFGTLQTLTADREEIFHLSASMVAQHRLAVLTAIKERLQTGRSCRVVSTTLVEAGVDLDFPVVYRALAGLDSIAQAAGRCNREGSMVERGETLIFLPQESHFANEGALKQAADHAWEIMQLPSYQENPLSLAALEHYFRLHYWQQGGSHGNGWDQKNIRSCFQLGSTKEPFLFHFRTAAALFQMTDSPQIPIIVAFDATARHELDLLQRLNKPEASLLHTASRRLQPYIVTINAQEYQTLTNLLAVTTVHERFNVLLQPELYYCSLTGLRLPEEEQEACE